MISLRTDPKGRERRDTKHIQLSEMEPKLETHQTNNNKKKNSTDSSINNNESRKVSMQVKLEGLNTEERLHPC